MKGYMRMKDFEQLSKKHFDKQANIYDETNTFYYSKFPKISCENVAEILKNYNYEKLLDIGCGTGYLIRLLQAQRQAQYFGIDISPNMIEVAKNKSKDHANFTVGSSSALPYADNTFDIVCCIQSFHHYPYPDKAIKEAYRVLKKHGLYILSDTGCGGIAKHFDNFIFKHFMRSGDYAVYSSKDIERMMIKHNFKAIETIKLSNYIYTVIGKKQ